jgi:HlyD family secretion protein
MTWMNMIHVAAPLTVAMMVAACSRGGDGALTGYAEADLVYVAASAGGTLEKLQVQRGARVEKGAPLFALDNDAEELGRAAAQAREQRAGAQAANLRKGRRAQEITAIEQQLAQARAGLAASKSELERNQQLVKQGFVAESRLDGLIAARDRDAARVAELQAQLAVGRDAARPDEIAAADAERRAASFDLAQSQWREDQKQRVAPLNALVYDVLFRIGEWVAAGAPVVALLPDGAVKVRFFVPQSMLSGIAIGQRVNVGCDGCPAGMSATIAYISPQAEFTPPVIYSNENRGKLVFMVEALPDNDAARTLKPGQPLDIRFAAR